VQHDSVDRDGTVDRLGESLVFINESSILARVHSLHASNASSSSSSSAAAAASGAGFKEAYF